ncbi:unnamed protein product [Cunninghamella echinulata]
MAFRSMNMRIAPRVLNRTALASTAIRTSLQPAALRTYTSMPPHKQGGSNILLFLGLAALGGAGGYYYHNSSHSVSTTQVKNIDYQQVYNDIAERLDDNDYDDGSYGPVLVRLAWHASGTYDKKTNSGGSNAASMRFEPEALHGANNGLKIAREFLEPIKAKYPEISYGDLWTLAGVCAIQELGGPQIPWRPGRIDGLNAESCTPDGRLPDAGQGESHIRDIFYRMGFNDQEIVALTGCHALGRCHPDRSGFDGNWSEQPTIFSNEYFKILAERHFVKQTLPTGGYQWVDKNNPNVMMLPAEIAMYNDKHFRKWFDIYAKDQDKFFKDFTKAFVTLIENGVPYKGDEKVYYFKTTV